MRRGGLIGSELIQVPADQIAHLKFSRRVGQTRGVPIFHAAIYRLDDIADYEDAHRIAARVAAQLMGDVKRAPDMVDYDPSSDERTWEMAHGQIIADMLPGEELNWYKPEAPNPDATPFLDDQMRRISSGFGMGYSTFSGKYDKSFSAARQEQSENWPNVERLRSQFVSDFVRPVEYEPALNAAIIAGLVRIPREADPATIYAADYRGPARPTIDDLKQANTDKALIESKTDSRVGRIRERGRDPSKVDAEINADAMRQQELMIDAPDEGNADE
jgi:lambda family phage portal protein